MPGFEKRGFDLPELGDGLNLIIGPNASGKTMTCHAIRGLLWPETLTGVSPVYLVSVWVVDGDLLRLELEGPQRTCQRDGVHAELPPLPGTHLAKCFTITVDDLFTDTQTDSDLASNVAREMAGGYDLNAIGQLDFLNLRRTHGRNELSALKEAKQQAKAIEAEQENLHSEEGELADLEVREREARNARARRERLNDVIELIGVRDQIGQAERALECFPAGMNRLRGNEAERLEQIREDLDNSMQALGEATGLAESARQQLTDAALPENGIPAVRVEEQQSQLDRLREAERDMGNIQRRLGEADQKVQSSLQALGDLAVPEKLDALDVEALNEIEAFHRATEDFKSRKSAIEARLNVLGEEEPQGDLDSLINGISILREWLEASPATPLVFPMSSIVLWTTTFFMGVIGLGLALFVNPWWLLLLAPAGIAALLAWWIRKRASVNRPQTCDDRYARLPLDPPSAWNREIVGTHLNALEQSLAQERHKQEHESERKARRNDLSQLSQEAKGLSAQRQGLIEKFGLAPDTSNLALVVLATNLRAYREAKVIRDACQDEKTTRQQERRGHLEAINAFLAEFGQEACDSHDAGRLRSKAVFRRAELHREARQQLTTAERDATSVRERVSTLQSRKTQLFEEVCLSEDEDTELENRLRILDDYRVAVQDLTSLKTQEASLSAKLEDAPDLVALSRDQAMVEASRLERMAEEYRQLVERTTQIHSRVDQARRTTRLEDAVAEVDEATYLLTERRQKAEFAAAGNFLLEGVEAEHKVESQPQVFRQASIWFSLFTRGRYELRVDDARESGSPAFRGLDTSTGSGLALDELSRGTRMQLLLAVRLAFAAAAERGTQLPFVLDEVLSSTDPMRYRAITESLLALVQDGRQVFYLTCQPGDATGWQEIAEGMGITDARRLDLADIQRLERATSGPLDDSAARIEPVPEPGGMALHEYQNLLRVPELDPAAGARATHLAHFVESPEQLHRFVRAGIETYGQLQSMASHGNVDAYVQNDMLARMQARACVLDAFSEAWRIGRGRPVSREALLEAGVSNTFIDRVTDLAKDLDCDAKRLVEALDAGTDNRTKGFRSASLATVKENLAELGYLDTRETLDEEAAYNRVLSAANDFVKRGTIDPGEMRELFIRYWGLSTRAEQA